MVANLLLLCSAALCGAAIPVSGPSEPAERFFLACKGTMRVSEGAATSPIIADGIVDLAKGQVYGFGIGGGPIVLQTATQIGFGQADTGRRGGQLVDGSINRTTGQATIRVRSPDDPTHFLIAMDLDCRFGPPPVF